MTLSLQEEWRRSSHFFKKSCTQVARWVGPHEVAPPKACGLKPKRKRDSPIKVRLNEAEKELVRKKAKEVNMSVNAFIKCMILDYDYDPKLRNALISVNRELTAQGRNFNQITKRVNSGYIATSHALEVALSSIQVPLVAALRAVKTALVNGAPQP